MISNTFKKILKIGFIGSFVFLLSACDMLGPEVKTMVMHVNGGQYEYAVEVVDTKEEREQGLMNRENLDEDKGMLFVFEEERRVSFWMKNTLIPLDMIFFDEDMKVVDYFVDVPPCKVEQCPHYTPGHEAKYVTELNAGQIAKMGLKRGDFAVLE